MWMWYNEPQQVATVPFSVFRYNQLWSWLGSAMFLKVLKKTKETDMKKSVSRATVFIQLAFFNQWACRSEIFNP